MNTGATLESTGSDRSARDAGDVRSARVSRITVRRSMRDARCTRSRARALHGVDAGTG